MFGGVRQLGLDSRSLTPLDKTVSSNCDVYGEGGKQERSSAYVCTGNIDSWSIIKCSWIWSFELKSEKSALTFEYPTLILVCPNKQTEILVSLPECICGLLFLLFNRPQKVVAVFIWTRTFLSTSRLFPFASLSVESASFHFYSTDHRWLERPKQVKKELRTERTSARPILSSLWRPGLEKPMLGSDLQCVVVVSNVWQLLSIHST